MEGKIGQSYWSLEKQVEERKGWGECLRRRHRED